MQFDRQNANIIGETSTILPDAEVLCQHLTVEEEVLQPIKLKDQGQLLKASAHHSAS